MQRRPILINIPSTGTANNNNNNSYHMNYFSYGTSSQNNNNNIVMNTKGIIERPSYTSQSGTGTFSMSGYSLM